MEYLGRAYKMVGVHPGDKVVATRNKEKYILEIIDLGEAIFDKDLSDNADYYVYGRVIEIINGIFKIGDCDGWTPVMLKPLNYKNKLLNNCPECNISGEYVNGAFKCPNCWKVW